MIGSRPVRARVCAAVVVMAVLVCAPAGASAQERAVGTHVIVGVEPLNSFDVTVAGESVPGSPATSSSVGVLSFELDDAGLPPGPNAVIISQNGDLIIGGVTAGSVTESTATITWSTNLPSTSRVDYGTTPSYGQSTPEDPTLVTSHSVTLEGLTPGTVHYYRVFSDDGAGGSAESGGHSFETESADLIISDVVVTNTTWSSARVRWTTDRPATSRVLYGTTPAYGEDSGEDATMVTSHDVFLYGLSPDTEYHFAVVSVDENQYSTQSADATFTTAVIPLVAYDVTVAAGTDSAVISWMTNRPADTRVEYGPTPDYGFETPLKTALVESHRDTIRGLAPGETYHYRVRSEASPGEVAYSADAEFTTELEPLSIDDVLADALVASASVTWVTNRVADSRVEYGLTEAYGQITPLDAQMVLGHEVELEELSAGAVYHYRVRSEDAFGNVAWSDDRTFQTLMPPPGIADVDVSSFGVTWAVIEWTTDQPTSGWVLHGTTAEYGDSTSSPAPLATAHACTLTGLAESTVYHFAVGARNAEGTVSVSQDGTFETMQGVPMAPPELSTPSVSSLNAMSVVVTWTTDIPATSTVRYSLAGGETRTIVNPSLALLHEIVITPVIPCLEYEYVVESESPGGVATSEPCCFRAGPSMGSDVDDKEPLIIRPAIIQVGERTAMVRYATDRPCTTWVEFGRDGGYDQTVSSVGTGECGYECLLVDLVPGTEYHFRISAMDELGAVVSSEDESFCTLDPPDLWPPEAPTGLSCRLEDDCVELAWNECAENDLAGYNVYRVRTSTDPLEPARAEKLNETLLSGAGFLDHEVEAGVMYSYQATAVDTAGNESAHSAAATVTMPAPPPAAVSFAHYPNPTRGEATMAFAVPGPDPSDVELRVISIDGRVVCRLADGEYPPGEHTAFWDGYERTGEVAASGIYVCELRVGESVVRRKLTLIR